MTRNPRNILYKLILPTCLEVVAVVADLTGADSNEPAMQIIESGKRLATLRAYAQTAWNLNPKLEQAQDTATKGSLNYQMSLPKISVKQ